MRFYPASAIAYAVALRPAGPGYGYHGNEMKTRPGNFTLKSAGPEKQIHSVWKIVKLTDNDKRNRVQDRKKKIKSFVKP